MTDSLPPPIYSKQDPDENPSLQSHPNSPTTEPQILIIPTADTVNFQKGFLGAEDERAAIEGELQIKGIELERWSKVTMSLRTVEVAYQLEIELGSSEIVLFSKSNPPLDPFPSSFPFAIPLAPDTPQSIQTPHSSLSHYLTATLHASDSHVPSLSKVLTVHTRRYSSHTRTLLVNPEKHVLNQPTRVEVEVPRTIFKAGESIPVYVTIPPPSRQLVVEQGMRLRNVRAELVRAIQVKKEFDENDTPEKDSTTPASHDGTPEEQGLSTSQDKNAHLSSSKTPVSPLAPGPAFRTTIARSGASCRFHSTRPVKLRFVLHQPAPSSSPSDIPVNLPSGEYGNLDSDAECASITQLTLLHSVTFQLKVHISFVDMTSRREHISIISIPITVIPPPAPLPEVSQALDAAYQKKHDKPPLKTVRNDESEHSIPHYSEGEAGPSVLPSSAPPPFEERDAPPPFFFWEGEASTSTRLPTFLESESSEIILPNNDTQHLVQLTSTPSITGEGSAFGFPPSQQFDGHSEDIQRSSTPPPSLEMATRDAEIHDSGSPMGVLGLTIDQRENNMTGERPPPPPAMDDPSDPPPSIDSDFRSPDTTRQSSPPRLSPPSHTSYIQSEPPRLHTPSPIAAREPQSSHGHAPPPYLVPDNLGDQENVTRPPPYMD